MKAPLVKRVGSPAAAAAMLLEHTTNQRRREGTLQLWSKQDIAARPRPHGPHLSLKMTAQSRRSWRPPLLTSNYLSDNFERRLPLSSAIAAVMGALLIT